MRKAPPALWASGKASWRRPHTQPLPWSRSVPRVKTIPTAGMREQHVQNPDTRGGFKALQMAHPVCPPGEAVPTPRGVWSRSGQESRAVLPHGENVPLRDVSEVHFKVSPEYKRGAQAGVRSLSPFPQATHRHNLRDSVNPSDRLPKGGPGVSHPAALSPSCRPHLIWLSVHGGLVLFQPPEASPAPPRPRLGNSQGTSRGEDGNIPSVGSLSRHSAASSVPGLDW